jgi:hypothetical protein
MDRVFVVKRGTPCYKKRAMIAFEAYLNGKKICVAGVGDSGVLSAFLWWHGPHPYKKGGPPVAQ